MTWKSIFYLLLLIALITASGCSSQEDDPPPLVITTTSLADGHVGMAYSQTLAATGGTPSYVWMVTVGTLPAGLTLTPGTGLISGTPTTAGTSNFTVQCDDSGIQSTTQPLSIQIDPNIFPRLVVANAGAATGVKI